MLRLFAMLCGALTGMALGMVLLAVIFVQMERRGGVQFAKEPLLWIPLIGIPLGGSLGAWAGLWSVTRKTRAG